MPKKPTTAKSAKKKPAAKQSVLLRDVHPPSAADALEPHVRPAWVPTLVAAKAGEKPEGLQSRLGGAPWLPQGESWPVCANCTKPMALLLQLDFATLPSGAPDYGDGLLQVFSCRNEKPNCEAKQGNEPFSPNAVVRIVSGEDGAWAPSKKAPGATSPRTITGWSEVEDLPCLGEVLSLGAEDEGEDFFDILEDLNVAVEGDKLAGWPQWAARFDPPVYPRCTTCNEPMRLLFQLGVDARGVESARPPCAMVTQCPTHKGVVALGWSRPTSDE